MNKPRILVIGGSISGMFTALIAANKGSHVDIISNTNCARSQDASFTDGIKGLLDTKKHISDTIQAGDFLAHEDVVTNMCSFAPDLIYMLDKIGVFFTRNKEGIICSDPFSYAGHNTGQQIINALDSQIRRFESQGLITKHENWDFLSLIIDDSSICRGAVAMNQKDLKVRSIRSDAVVLCEKGYAGIFESTTCGVHSHGYALTQAFKQGACFANPEFINFYPLTVPGKDKMHIIDYKVGDNGVRFFALEDGKPGKDLTDYKSIWQAFYENNPVYIDIQDDRDNEPIKIMPAANYSLGGLFVDDNHQTTVHGLFAAGGCEYQYHGAGLLKENILLAELFAGFIAGKQSVKYAKNNDISYEDVMSSVFEKECLKQEELNRKFMSMDGKENPHIIKQELANILFDQVGIIRDSSTLDIALDNIETLEQNFAESMILDKGEWMNKELFFMRTLYNQFDLAKLIINAAKNREETRGVHYRSDFPDNNDKKWHCLTKAIYEKGNIQFNYKDKIKDK